MRALAVGLVIAAHAGASRFAGGYVGVDVFFVISGFLITQVLIKRTGVVDFYARRARRILPAAAFTLFGTLVAARAMLGALEIRTLNMDVVWASLFGANIRYAYLGADYFHADDAPSAVQHFWSLAVEEQFYLAWPLIVGLALVGGIVRGRRRLVLVSVTVIAVSLAWSVHATTTSPETAYFSTFTRAWELAVGALLASMPTSVWARLSHVVRELFAWLGLAMIAAAAMVYTPATSFPGYAALLPVAGAALIVASGTGTQATTTLTRLIWRWRPLQRAGDWSYSLYLIHWPVLVLPALAAGEDLRGWHLLLALLLIVAFSGLSFRFVERPFREASLWRTRRAVLLYPASVLPLLLLVTWSAHSVNQALSESGDVPAISTTNFGAEPGSVEFPADPRLALVKASVLAARNHVAIPSDLTPDLVSLENDVAGVGECDYSEEVFNKLCPHGDPAADRTLVLYGDSHARMWIPAVDEIARDLGYRAYFLVKPHCTGSLVQPVIGGTRMPYVECQRFHEWFLDQVEELDPELTLVTTSSPQGSAGVIIDGRWINSHDGVLAEVEAGFDRLFAALADREAPAVLLRDVPRIKERPSECLARKGTDLGACSSAPQAFAEQLADVSVNSATRSGVPIIDPRPWICFDDTCPMVVGSTVAYRDVDHLTVTYVAELVGELQRALSERGLGSPRLAR